jgi:hypothetical protein
VGGEQRGFDGGKKVKGRKRHLLVDTEGFVLSRACYEPGLRMLAACWRKRQANATKCNPATVSGSLS